jgi:hypothetical protein
VTNEQVWLVVVGAVALTSLVLAALARQRAVRAEALLTSYADRLALLESRVADARAPRHSAADVAPVVITQMGGAREADTVPVVAQRIDGRLFSDIVARETVVKAASWTHGLRRALSAESRNRIRFQVRQETRRAARDRRAETKQALREFRARARADTTSPLDVGEDVA